MPEYCVFLNVDGQRLPCEVSVDAAVKDLTAEAARILKRECVRLFYQGEELRDQLVPLADVGIGPQAVVEVALAAQPFHWDTEFVGAVGYGYMYRVSKDGHRIEKVDSDETWTCARTTEPLKEGRTEYTVEVDCSGDYTWCNKDGTSGIGFGASCAEQPWSYCALGTHRGAHVGTNGQPHVDGKPLGGVLLPLHPGTRVRCVLHPETDEVEFTVTSGEKRETFIGKWPDSGEAFREGKVYPGLAVNRIGFAAEFVPF
eukprot:TRINITY_DN6523_c0_g1_i4.p1 TRINITY_DN6523_c0_g1~~TRINITY_DN6523_c0_g1_i4.p1  ORF type:complete len:257 (+),score=37.04 TRINITY_DN6523_c0_g1_i4:67-837(+)